MKKSILMAVVVLLAATSCSNESVNDVENAVENVLVPVTVNVSDFSVSLENISEGTTRAADPATYDGVKSLTLAFYAGDGTEAFKTTQAKGALEEGETFGEFTLRLPMGNYTMVVIGHGLNDGEPAVTLTSPTEATFGEYPARDICSHPDSEYHEHQCC